MGNSNSKTTGGGNLRKTLFKRQKSQGDIVNATTHSVDLGAVPAAVDTRDVLLSQASTGSSQNADLPSLLPPWSDISIDREALKELHEWDRNHRSEDFPSILEKIGKVVESDAFKNLLDLIPNLPIPVGTLVKGLVAVMALGLKFQQQKQEAVEFAMQVLRDLSVMAGAIGVTPPGENADSATTQCWHDLRPFCEITNDVCKWAHEQVKSKVPFSSEEQATFEKRLTRANTLLLQLSTIKMTRSIFCLGQDVVKLLGHYDRANQLQDIKRFFGSHLAERYQWHDQGKPDCSENTREEILQELDSWIRAPSTGTVPRCLWMTGIPGIGKTAIGITAVQCLQDKKQLSSQHENASPVQDPPMLCAEYFCNHKIDSTSQINHLFPTLAMQLAEEFPAAAYIISEQLQKQPTLAHKFSLEQAKAIFLLPLCHLAASAPMTRLICIIDGVDEFQGDVLNDLTSCLGMIASRLPDNTRLIIQSRPEHQIISQFHKHLSIRRRDLTPKESLADVQRYFMAELKKLGELYTLVGFPTNDQHNQLCTAAAGHMGWANQARSWLHHILENRSKEVLDDEINQIAQFAQGDLDGLYCHILDKSLPAKGFEKEEDKQGLQMVLRSLSALREPQSISTISGLIKPGFPFNVSNCLKRLSSLYISALGPASIMEDTLVNPHKSFFDFITTRAQPGLCVDNLPEAHHELVLFCFSVMQKELHVGVINVSQLDGKEGNPKVTIAGHIRYACFEVAYHVQQSGQCFVNEIPIFAQKFFYWLEVMASLGATVSEEDRIGEVDRKSLTTAGTILSNFNKTCQGDPELISFLEAANKFIEAFRYAISYHPMAIYTTVLPFIPHLSTISRYHPSRSRACFLNTKQNLRPEWGLHITFSPDGKWIATTTTQGVSLFSVETCAVIWSRQTQIKIYHFYFSSDGKFLACVSSSTSPMTVQVRDTTSGDTVNQISFAPTDNLLNLKFSPDNSHVTVLVANNTNSVHTIYTIEIESGKTTWKSDAEWNQCVWYLPNDKLPSAFRHYSQVGGEGLDRPPFHTNASFLSVSVSPDGLLLAAVDQGGIDISIWETAPERFVTKLTGCNSLSHTCFSPDGKLLISFGDRVVQIWQCSLNIQPWTCIAILYGHWDCLKDLAFLPDGKRIICASEPILMLREHNIGKKTKTVVIFDISAALEGRNFDVQLDDGALAVKDWYSQVLPLGGWDKQGNPFIFDHPFKLPSGVTPLKWEMGLDMDGGRDVETDKINAEMAETCSGETSADVSRTGQAKRSVHF